MQGLQRSWDQVDRLHEDGTLACCPMQCCTASFLLWMDSEATVASDVSLLINATPLASRVLIRGVRIA